MTEPVDAYQGEIRIDWTDFCKTIADARNIVVCAHIRPDGDAIGSALAMKRALVSLGKNVMTINGQEVPPSLRFLDANDEIRVIASLTDEERAFLDAADLLMSVDVSSWQQLGPDASEVFRTFKGKIAVIDHHAVRDEIGDVRCVESRSDSAGSIVFEAVRALGVELTREIAVPLFTAISSDTGWFRFGATKARTMERAAALIAAGAKVDEIYRLTNEQESYGRFKLLGVISSGARLFLNGKGVLMSISSADFAASGAALSDSEDLVNTPLSVAGMEVSVIAIEQPDGSVKASFRSRCDLDCSLLAREFGGGGHKRAAGATLPGDLESATNALMEKTREYYDALPKRES